MDCLQASEIYRGFSREEIKEINIEMPQLRKEEKMLIKARPKKQLTVKSSKLLNLDAIEEIQTKNNQQTTQKILA